MRNFCSLLALLVGLGLAGPGCGGNASLPSATPTPIATTRPKPDGDQVDAAGKKWAANAVAEICREFSPAEYQRWAAADALAGGKDQTAAFLTATHKKLGNFRNVISVDWSTVPAQVGTDRLNLYCVKSAFDKAPEVNVILSAQYQNGRWLFKTMDFRVVSQATSTSTPVSARY